MFLGIDPALLAEARAARIKTSDLALFQAEAAAELSRRIADGSPLSSEGSSSDESDAESDAELDEDIQVLTAVFAAQNVASSSSVFSTPGAAGSVFFAWLLPWLEPLDVLGMCAVCRAWRDAAESPELSELWARDAYEGGRTRADLVETARTLYQARKSWLNFYRTLIQYDGDGASEFEFHGGLSAYELVEHLESEPQPLRSAWIATRPEDTYPESDEVSVFGIPARRRAVDTASTPRP